MSTFARRLREARESRSWSQRDLWRESGVPQSSIDRYEREDQIPRLDAAFKLADALGVSVEELWRGK
jgi:transcriptional regulator with XRE-family HTH domain